MTRPLARGPWTSRPHRRAFTLFELLITLVIVAIASTMVGLAWRTPAPALSDVRAVISEARALAVRSEETLRMELRTTGGWQIRSTMRHAILAQGALRERGESLTLDVDPLGTCQPVTDGGRPDSAAVFDPLRCIWRASRLSAP